MEKFVVTALLVIFLVSSANSFNHGAPSSACSTLEPKHGTTKSNASLTHYSVIVAKQVAVKRDKLQVMITSREGIPFHGFILQARVPGTINPLGTFTSIPDNAQFLNCSGGTQNTVTHTDAFKKKSMKFEWEPPSDFDGEVIFNATVVQDYEHFKTGIVSDPVRVADHSGDNSSHSVGISTTKSPKTTTTPEPYTPETITKAAVKADPLYDGCGVTKACFGSVDDCIAMQNCPAFVSCLVKGSEYEFEIKADGTDYVAVGLSDDDKMGEDSVVECAHDQLDGNKVNAYMSWNPAKWNERLTESKGIELLKGMAEDGSVYCKFKRDEVTEVRGRTYDLAKNKYFLLLAAGPLNAGDKSLGFHVLTQASKESKYLSDVSGFSGASKLLLRLHGAFMVGAWIGSASLGILLARYYRQTWVGTQFCGKDLWFTWHRMFMLLTWSLTVVAFVLIFVDRKEWSREENPHAILGVITTFLAFIQPFGAAFRPHPDSSRRPIFNWLHWLIGNVAHILAIVTIFFSIKLSKALLPDWLLEVLVAYVAFHVCIHLVLSVAGCISERQSGKRVNSFPMRDINNSQMPLQSIDRKQDAPHSCFRKLVLAVFIVGILAITVAIIVIIVLAPIEEEWEKLTTRIAGN